MNPANSLFLFPQNISCLFYIQVSNPALVEVIHNKKAQCPFSRNTMLLLRTFIL